MSTMKLLRPKGVFKGPFNNKEQVYFLIGEDEDGNQYSAPFACQLIYTDQVEKGLSRLMPCAVKPETESTEAGSDTTKLDS